MRPSHPAYLDPHFNPTVEYVMSAPMPFKVAVVHVGKCAGGSIIATLKTFLPKDRTSIFEYHCFDANETLGELINTSPEIPDLHFVICARDPLDRWISAFNWDKHNLGILNGTCSNAILLDLYTTFPTVDRLALALVSDSPHEKAVNLAKAAHMGMGISWYLPRHLILKLPRYRTVTIRTEHITRDTVACVEMLAANMGASFSKEYYSKFSVPVTKNEYQQNYPVGSFSNLDNVPYSAIKQLKRYLARDYESQDAVLRYILP
jgi:hypothetical protein